MNTLNKHLTSDLNSTDPNKGLSAPGAKALNDKISALESGAPVAIAFNDPAPTTTHMVGGVAVGTNGYYEFSTAGNCAWITGGAVNVNVGDRVSVVFTSGSYNYKYIEINYSSSLVTNKKFESILYTQINGNKTIDVENTYPILLWLQNAIKDCRISTNFENQNDDMIVIGTIDSTVIDGESNFYLSMGYNRGSRLISWNLNIPFSQYNSGIILKSIIAQSDDGTKHINIEILADWKDLNTHTQSGSFGFLNMDWVLAKNHPLIESYVISNNISSAVSPINSTIFSQVKTNKPVIVEQTSPALLWIIDAIKDISIKTNFDRLSTDYMIIGTIDTVIKLDESNFTILCNYVQSGAILFSITFFIPFRLINKGIILISSTAKNSDGTKIATIEIAGDWKNILTQSGNFSAVNMDWMYSSVHQLIVNLKFNSLIPKEEVNSILCLGNSISTYPFDGGYQGCILDFFKPKYFQNMSCGSARLKDDSSDTTTNPYTNRPVNFMTGVNKNVLHSQVLKLKRLMAGTDLDSGETRIYTDVSQYPKLILIEGGTNDGADSQLIMDNPDPYFFTRLTGQYAIVNYGDAAQPGQTIDITKPIENVDKTTWYGAMRYLVEELLTMFPKTQIIFISPAQRIGITSDEVNGQILKSSQMKQAAGRLSQPIFQWDKEGNVCDIFNRIRPQDPSHMETAGTSANPWLITNAQRGDYLDLPDGVHPGNWGSWKLGQAVLNYILYKLYQ